LLGPRQASNALLPGEKRAVAIHESGHALVALCSEHADPVTKVTILPAGQSLGATQQLPTDERHLYSESYLNESLAVRLGGRAAELLVLGEASTGAANDLAGATELATKMVRDWGFSLRLGPIGFGSGRPAYLGHQLESRPYAEGTQLVIDQEVSRILSEAGERAAAMLAERRASLDAVIDLLLEKETISGEELMEVVRGPAGNARATVAIG
jgi:cell division protease FtsH